MNQLFIFKEKNAELRKAQRLAEKGLLTKLIPNVYTDAISVEDIDLVVKMHWQEIAEYRYPNAVVSFNSALNNGIYNNLVILTHPTLFNKKLKIGSITFVTVKGPSCLPMDLKLGNKNLWWSSRVRMFLENIGYMDSIKSGSKKIESKLIDLYHMSSTNNHNLNNLLTQIETIDKANDFFKDKSFILKEMINDILNKNDKKLTVDHQNLIQYPVDKERMYRFNILADHLRSLNLPVIPAIILTKTEKLNFTALESYFSNFVEGTHFNINEAIEMVLSNKIQQQRPNDSHDILGVFKYAYLSEFKDTLPSVNSFLEDLQKRHAYLAKYRPEMLGGQFKQVLNYAGTVKFVEPIYINGTLLYGANLALTIPEGLPRAIFYAFLITEVHPFMDGNGRLSRLLMNAELTRVGQNRIIMPMLHHQQYIDCQRVLTLQNHPEGYIKSIVSALKWCTQFDYSDLQSVINEMTQCNAFEQSSVMYKLLNRNDINQYPNISI